MRRLLLLALLLPTPAFAECTPGTPEPFETFIEAFARDKQFALARVRHPIPLHRHQAGAGNDEDAVTRTSIPRSDDAAQPTLQAFARKNGLQLSTSSVRNDEAVVRMEKPDTDWMLTYHFKRQGPCWFLDHIEDHSL